MAGGAALFTALSARAAGIEVGLHSVVGEDYPLELLTQAGIHLNLQRLDGPGGRALITYGDGERRLEHRGPGHQAMTPQKAHPFSTKLVHIAPMPWESQLFHLAQAQPGTAFLDPYPTLNRERWSSLEPWLDRLCYLVLNVEELEVDIDLIPESVPVLLKQGAEGGFSRLSQCRWKAVPTQVVDPTGAGDSFVGGVAAGLVQGLLEQACLDLGAKMAAHALSAQGALGLVKLNDDGF